MALVLGRSADLAMGAWREPTPSEDSPALAGSTEAVSLAEERFTEAEGAFMEAEAIDSSTR
jgi:hypothetical protein